MDLFMSLAAALLQLLFLSAIEVDSASFMFVNRCGVTVWPGILSNAGSGALGTTGFELPSGSSRALQAPGGWSGRFWARTGCTFDSSGRGNCATGDCGSGAVECSGAGATPPATLAEFTLASGSASKDFYDISLVDGYNLPMTVEPSGSAGCAAAGCAADLNERCPPELRVASSSGSGAPMACRSACDAFNKAEYCCSGAYANPTTCRPTAYSQLFKSACPKSYSYAFDDPTSTFTCSAGSNYVITFCPVATPSLKTIASSPPATAATTTLANPAPGTTTTPPQQQQQQPTTMPAAGTGGAAGGVMLQDDSWLASLATGEATSSTRSSSKASLVIFLLTWSLIRRI